MSEYLKSQRQIKPYIYIKKFIKYLIVNSIFLTSIYELNKVVNS